MAPVLCHTSPGQFSAEKERVSSDLHHQDRVSHTLFLSASWQPQAYSYYKNKVMALLPGANVLLETREEMLNYESNNLKHFNIEIRWMYYEVDF